MSTSPLQAILDSTVAQFISLKAKGGATAPDVIAIATSTFKVVCTLAALSVDEKKAFIFMALQKGLAAAGPLQGLVHVDSAIVSAVETQTLHVAVNTVFAFAEAYPQVVAEIEGALSYVRSSLSKCLPGCSQAAAVVATLDPKDSALIEQAVAALKAVTTTVAGDPAPLAIRNVESTQESVASAVSQ